MLKLPDKIKEGDYFILVASAAEIDSVGFQARREGLEVRDSFVIHTMEGPVCAILSRCPFQATVVEEIVRSGSGAYDIDSCRISTSDTSDGGDTSSGKRGAGYGDRPWMHDEERLEERKIEARDRVEKAENMGRWPSNVILMHGPACVCVGTKRVKPSNGSGTAHQDNKEVANQVYQGEPSCPVTLLDQQSGISTSVDAVRRNNISLGSSAGGIYSEGTSYFEGGGYSDKGGASRFFKQVETLPDLIWYLSALVGSEANVMWVRV